MCRVITLSNMATSDIMKTTRSDTENDRMRRNVSPEYAISSLHIRTYLLHQSHFLKSIFIE